MQKRKLIKRFVSLLCLLTMLVPAPFVKAEPPEVKIQKGILKFETIDTKATTATRWKTVGFTITRTKGYGDPTTVKERSELRLESKWKKDC